MTYTAVKPHSHQTPHLQGGDFVFTAHGPGTSMPGLHDMPTTMGDRIRRHRIAAGMSQRALAATLGIRAPSVAQWEANQSKPEHHRLPAVAEALGIDLDTLIRDDLKAENMQLAELVRIASSLDTEALQIIIAMAKRLASQR